MIDDSLKEIYNNHLVISRTVKGEPYKIKKDFSKLDEDKVMALEKLARLFSSHTNINQKDFFIAPYKIFPEETYYPLDFYYKPKAISCYTQYMKLLEIQDPDSPESLERLQKSLKFVFEYCREKGLTLDQYELNIEESLPCFVQHLKDHKINFYTLHALTFSNPKLESNLLDFIFSDFYGTFQKTKNKFFSSKRMKEFAKQARQKIQTKLNELKNN